MKKRATPEAFCCYGVLFKPMVISRTNKQTKGPTPCSSSTLPYSGHYDTIHNRVVEWQAGKPTCWDQYTRAGRRPKTYCMGALYPLLSTGPLSASMRKKTTRGTKNLATQQWHSVWKRKKERRKVGTGVATKGNQSTMLASLVQTSCRHHCCQN